MPALLETILSPVVRVLSSACELIIVEDIRLLRFGLISCYQDSCSTSVSIRVDVEVIRNLLLRSSPSCSILSLKMYIPYQGPGVVSGLYNMEAHPWVRHCVLLNFTIITSVLCCGLWQRQEPI